MGGAVGHNPISLLIPCHRVVGADGSLTGYAGGVDKKAQLLKLGWVCCGKGMSPFGYFRIILTAQNTRDKAMITFTGF